jgi:hypothetical protein
MAQVRKQNVTISLRAEVVQKARVLAARRATSISGMLAEQLEALVTGDEAQQLAATSAIARMQRGLHLGGGSLVSREALHER